MKACTTNGYRVWQALSLWLLAACHSADGPTAHAARDASVSSDAGTRTGADAAVEPRDTARAQAKLEPTVAAESGTDGPIALFGTAALWQHGRAVTLRLDIRACKPGTQYQARVHAGSDCSERTLAGETWPAGEGIGAFSCTPEGAIIAYHARRPDSDKPWTLAGAADTNVVGHALSLSEAATGRPVTCGVIERAADAPPSETTDSVGPTLQIRGAIAGVCVFDRLVPKHEPGCPDYATATGCASTYCELNRCIDRCATYVKCLAQARGLDVCMAAYSCEPSAECSQCQSDVVRCALSLCLDTLTCAAPARPDGPCSQLQQCCANESDPTACLDLTGNLARFGDDQCQRLIDSWNVSGQRSSRCPAD
jgi:hypothetical protein